MITWKTGGFFNRTQHGNFKQKKWPEIIAKAFNPVEFAKIILFNIRDAFRKKLESSGINELEALDIMEKVFESYHIINTDECSQTEGVDKEKLETVMKIAEIEWDDIERIMMNELPVENLSPGQRSSAMIPLIALAESSPLIIDQPEDNLDNKLVGGMLSDIFADLKEKRQIILATHNPNIVVSGDAEQVIVLNAKSDKRGVCEDSGSIDKPSIIGSVIDIMEGGRDAFEARKKRYNL